MSDDPLNYFIDKKSKAMYVILLKGDSGKPALLFDPGNSRPWSSENENLAKFYANSCNGRAFTWSEAWSILAKEFPNLEKALYKQIYDKVNQRPNDFTAN